MKQADLCESTERSSLPREMEFGRRCRRTTCHAFCGRYLSFDRYLSPVDASLGKSSLIGSRDYFASWTSVADFRLYASFRDFARPAAVFRLPIATYSDRCGLFIKREREREISWSFGSVVGLHRHSKLINKVHTRTVGIIRVFEQLTELARYLSKAISVDWIWYLDIWMLPFHFDTLVSFHNIVNSLQYRRVTYATKLDVRFDLWEARGKRLWNDVKYYRKDLDWRFSFFFSKFIVKRGEERRNCDATGLTVCNVSLVSRRGTEKRGREWQMNKIYDRVCYVR